eukprot:14760298-Alexandrium_andersonii.AAC.1
MPRVWDSCPSPALPLGRCEPPFASVWYNLQRLMVQLHLAPSARLQRGRLRGRGGRVRRPYRWSARLRRPA